MSSALLARLLAGLEISVWAEELGGALAVPHLKQYIDSTLCRSMWTAPVWALGVWGPWYWLQAVAEGLWME